MKSLRTAVQKATGVKCHSTLGWHTCHDLPQAPWVELKQVVGTIPHLVTVANEGLLGFPTRNVILMVTVADPIYAL